MSILDSHLRGDLDDEWLEDQYPGRLPMEILTRRRIDPRRRLRLCNPEAGDDLISFLIVMKTSPMISAPMGATRGLRKPLTAQDVRSTGREALRESPEVDLLGRGALVRTADA